MKSKDDILYEAKVCAVKLMGKTSYSYKGMIKKLCDKGFDEDVAEKTAGHYRELGYLDDFKYAVAYIKNAVDFKHYGYDRIMYGLRQKGVDEFTAEDAFAELDIDFYESAYELAEAKADPETLSDFKQRMKLSGFLRRRGFSYDQIEYAINELRNDG